MAVARRPQFFARSTTDLIMHIPDRKIIVAAARLRYNSRVSFDRSKLDSKPILRPRRNEGHFCVVNDAIDISNVGNQSIASYNTVGAFSMIDNLSESRLYFA